MLTAASPNKPRVSWHPPNPGAATPSPFLESGSDGDISQTGPVAELTSRMPAVKAHTRVHTRKRGSHVHTRSCRHRCTCTPPPPPQRTGPSLHTRVCILCTHSHASTPTLPHKRTSECRPRPRRPLPHMPWRRSAGQLLGDVSGPRTETWLRTWAGRSHLPQTQSTALQAGGMDTASSCWKASHWESMMGEGQGEGRGAAPPTRGPRQGMLRAAANLRTVGTFQALRLCGSAPPARQ